MYVQNCYIGPIANIGLIFVTCRTGVSNLEQQRFSTIFLAPPPVVNFGVDNVCDISSVCESIHNVMFRGASPHIRYIFGFHMLSLIAFPRLTIAHHAKGHPQSRESQTGQRRLHRSAFFVRKVLPCINQCYVY